MDEQKFLLTQDEFNKLTADASIASAIKALAETLSNRADDLPHRFRAPKSMAEYMVDWGTNSTYVFQPIMGGNSANPLMLQITTRPTQKILELVFQGSDGMRLFTLEIEYAVPEER